MPLWSRPNGHGVMEVICRCFQAAFLPLLAKDVTGVHITRQRRLLEISHSSSQRQSTGAVSRSDIHRVALPLNDKARERAGGTRGHQSRSAGTERSTLHRERRSRIFSQKVPKQPVRGEWVVRAVPAQIWYLPIVVARSSRSSLVKPRGHLPASCELSAKGQLQILRLPCSAINVSPRSMVNGSF